VTREVQEELARHPELPSEPNAAHASWPPLSVLCQLTLKAMPAFCPSCRAATLPVLTPADALDTTRLHRVAGRTDARTALIMTRPCRAPYHTIADVGLIGGQLPMLGEVSLAQHGGLLLDKLPEFRGQSVFASSRIRLTIPAYH
jgi:hypothetical protein